MYLKVKKIIKDFSSLQKKNLLTTSNIITICIYYYFLTLINIYTLYYMNRMNLLFPLITKKYLVIIKQFK